MEKMNKVFDKLKELDETRAGKIYFPLFEKCSSRSCNCNLTIEIYRAGNLAIYRTGGRYY